MLTSGYEENFSDNRVNWRCCQKSYQMLWHCETALTVLMCIIWRDTVSVREDAYASWIDETEQKGTNDDFTVLSRRHWATLQIGMLFYELHMIYRRQKVSATPTIEVKKSKGLPWWLSGKTSACQSKERQVQSLIQEDPTGHGATKPMHHNY